MVCSSPTFKPVLAYGATAARPAEEQSLAHLLAPQYYNGIAIVGLGKVGIEISHNLAQQGLSLSLWNRSQRETGELANNGNVTIESSLAAACRGKDVVILCLSDGKASRENINQIVSELPEHERPKTIINLATIHPQEAIACACIADACGVKYLDCAFTGGIPSVKSRTSFIIAAGDPDTFSRASDVLYLLGESIMYVGPEAGLSQQYKAINQYVSAHHHLLLAQAFAYAKLWKLDKNLIRENFFNKDDPNYILIMNWAVENKFDEVLNGKLKGHHSVKNFLKDLEIVAEVLPMDELTSRAHTVYDSFNMIMQGLRDAIKAGRGDEPHHILHEILAKRKLHFHIPGSNKINFYSWAKVHNSIRERGHWAVAMYFEDDLQTCKLDWIREQLGTRAGCIHEDARFATQRMGLDWDSVFYMLQSGTGRFGSIDDPDRYKKRPIQWY